MKKFTKKALNELKRSEEFNSRVERKVINSLLSTGLNAEELKDHIKDILQYGCINGTVNDMIYYTDTVKFFNCYRKEILSMLQDPDKSDKIVNYFDDTYWLDHKRYSIEEKNHLAWFIYEDITCRIALHFNLV